LPIFISSGCANKELVMVPAGLEAATGIMSVGALKPYSADSTDPDLVAYRDFMKARLPNIDPANLAAGYGYMVAQALVVVLTQCKNDLSRENIMAQAANLKGVSLPMLMPGVTLNTSPTDYRPIKDGYMVEFRDNQFNVDQRIAARFMNWRPVRPARSTQPIIDAHPAAASAPSARRLPECPRVRRS